MAHVVIAEDEPLLLNILCEIVMSLGWTFDAVANGADALGVVERIIPDVVISNINMPGMRGTELARSIKGNSQLAHIPVVLLSSPDGEGEAIASGCTAFVSKPFDVAALQSLLSQLE